MASVTVNVHHSVAHLPLNQKIHPVIPPPPPPNVGPPLVYIEMNSTFYNVLKFKKEKSILISTAM